MRHLEIVVELVGNIVELLLSESCKLELVELGDRDIHNLYSIKLSLLFSESFGLESVE